VDDESNIKISRKQVRKNRGKKERVREKTEE
jgi:hypothetical protein